MGRRRLVRKLIAEPTESECVEFKVNKNDPEMIGKSISALSNATLLEPRDRAFMIWGVEDSTHDIVGTTFDPFKEKKGNEDLLNWLRKSLSNNFDFQFDEVDIDGKAVVIQSVGTPTYAPAEFQNNSYIRDGSHTTLLSKLPQLQRKIWNALGTHNHELVPVDSDLTADDVLSLLDWQTAMKGLAGVDNPRTEAALDVLIKNGLVSVQPDGGYGITLVGAVLYARDMTRIGPVSNKTLRVVQYSGISRSKILRQLEYTGGYVTIFEQALRDMSLMLPTRQTIMIGKMVREDAFPSDVIRELLANALIHQDLTDRNRHVTVEIFDGRIEFTNAGDMLIDPMRIVDWPPTSRNRKVPAIMRRLELCEEMGSGWDRMVESCERCHIPAPTMQSEESYTRAVLRSAVPYDDMAQEDKVWACYLHACFRHINGERMTNSSLRARFAVDDARSVDISRLIRATCEQGLIRLYDETVARRDRSYVPFWA